MTESEQTGIIAHVAPEPDGRLYMWHLATPDGRRYFGAAGYALTRSDAIARANGRAREMHRARKDRRHSPEMLSWEVVAYDWPPRT